MKDFNAAKAFKDYKRNYLEFLVDRTIGGVSPTEEELDRWTDIKKQLISTWGSDNPHQGLFAKPILEGLFPYPDCGKKFSDLIRAVDGEAVGVFDPRMMNLVDPGLASGAFNLYTHQLEAAKQVNAGKNIIVSSGTGSGKTECFLYPMLNQILRGEDEESLKEPGVRVLMIYPMNALVKDQLKRMVKLLKNQDLITVGMYTSQTPNRYSNGKLDDWGKQPNSNNPYGCLRASRHDIRNAPPHILITNYSMLEYMMLRNKDAKIFSDNKLKAVVLDEAHLYTGNLANDITMLIRRALLRMNKTHEDIRFYATSATIGDGSPEGLRSAAANLFGVSKDTVAPITGDRDFPVEQSGDSLIFDEEVDKVVIPENEDGIQLDDNELKKLKDIRHRLIINKNHLAVDSSEVDLLEKALKIGASYRKKGDVSSKLFAYLPFKLHCFVDSPRYFYSDLKMGQNLPLGNLSRQKNFGDGVEGLQVFTTDQNRKDIYFKARAKFVESGNNAANWYFYNDDLDGNEIRTAENVSVVRNNKAGSKVVIFRFRVAGFDDDSVGFKLVPSGGCWKVDDNCSEENRGEFVLAVQDSQNRADVLNVNEEEWYSAQGKGEKLKIFGIQRDSEVDDIDDGFDDEVDDNQTSSYNAGHMLMPLGMVIESLRSQLTAELLFPNLVDAKKNNNESDEEYQERLNRLPWRGRQMLVFADSRCNAANAALLMQDKHQREYIKSCIYKVLRIDEGCEYSFSTISDLIAADNMIYNQLVLPQWMLDNVDEGSLQECKGYMIKGLVANELLRKPSDRSLEGCGAIKHIVNVDDRNVNHQMMAEAGLSEWNDDTLKMVLRHMADLMREKRCVYIQDWYGKKIGVDDYSLRAYYHGLSYLGKRYHIKELKVEEPTKSVHTDNIIHMYPDGGKKEDTAPFIVPDQLKSEIKEIIIECNLAQDENSAVEIASNLNRYLVGIAPRVFAMDRRNVADPESVLFVKDQQDRIVVNADAFRFRVNNEAAASATYDFVQNTGTKNVKFQGCDYCWAGLRVPEHSAQLDVFRLSRIEEKFRNQEINVISCTPTMEVGVDIGGLSVVALQGVPPERANYFQRVGRAGRRDQNSALALTMTGKGGNSDAIFENPTRIFTAPNLYREADISSLISREQVKKHIFQYLIGCAFQKGNLNTEENGDNPIKAWENTGNFLGTTNVLGKYISWISDDEDESKLAKEIKELVLDGAFCDKVAELTIDDCKQYKQLIKNSSCEDLSFDDAISELVNKLNRCKIEFNLEMANIIKKVEKFEKGDEQSQRRGRALKRQFFTMYKKELIAFLAHKRIIPAFGFPIDVLSFAAGDKTSIERDASTAIREFIPGAQFTIGHAKYRVDALAKNYYSDINGLYTEFYLCHCSGCNGTFIQSTSNVTECKICHKHTVPGVIDKEDLCNAAGSVSDVQIEVRRYIVPRNYLSFQSGANDGVNTTSGFVWAKTDEKLIIGNPAVALNLQRSTQQSPAPMSFDVISSTSEKVHSVVYNSGTAANGYLLNTETGQIISKPRDERGVQRICNKWEEKYPGVSIQGRTTAKATDHGVDLAFASQIGAFVIGVPCYYGDEDVMATTPSIRKLLLMAFLKKASDMLNIDARLLKKYNYVWKNENNRVALLCIYDSSGNDNYLIELRDRKNELRDATIEIFAAERTVSQIREDVYCYANSYEFSSITDADICGLQQWIKDNRTKLIQGEYIGLVDNVGNVHKVNHLASIADPIAALSATDKVTILVGDCNLEGLSGGVIMTALQNAAEINVVYDKKLIMPESMDGGADLSELGKYAAVKLRNRLRDRVVGINKIHVYLGEFDGKDSLGIAYDFGVRLIINNDQYIAYNDNNQCVDFPFVAKGSMSDDEYKKYEKSEYAEFLKSAYKIVENAFNISANELMPFDLTRESEPEIYANSRVLEFSSNETYLNRPIENLWKEFGLNIASVELLEYSDVYFKNVRTWRGLSLLMEGLKFSNNAMVSIVTSAVDERKDRYIYEFRGDGLRDVRCDRVIIGSAYYVTEAEAQNVCAEYLGRKFGFTKELGAIKVTSTLPIKIEYTENHLPHARLLDITYIDSNGKKKKARLAFDKGMDFIRYDKVVAKNSELPYREKIKLFDDAIKDDLFYDYTLISLIKDEELENGH